jgi:hypothetical protein
MRVKMKYCVEQFALSERLSNWGSVHGYGESLYGGCLGVV